MNGAKIKLVKLPKKNHEIEKLHETANRRMVTKQTDETANKRMVTKQTDEEQTENSVVERSIKDITKDNTKDSSNNISNDKLNIGLNNTMVNLSVPKKRMMRRTNIKAPQSNIIKMRTTGAKMRTTTKMNKNKSNQILSSSINTSEPLKLHHQAI